MAVDIAMTRLQYRQPALIIAPLSTVRDCARSSTDSPNRTDRTLATRVQQLDGSQCDHISGQCGGARSVSALRVLLSRSTSCAKESGNVVECRSLSLIVLLCVIVYAISRTTDVV